MDRLTQEKQIGPFAALKDEAEAVPGAFGTYDCLYAHMVAVTRLKEYEDTGLEPEEIRAMMEPPEPNDPLTLEELREMDGKPVWVVALDDFDIQQANYLVNAYAGQIVVDKFGAYLDFEDYGKTWMAYRRKPTEAAP